MDCPNMCKKSIGRSGKLCFDKYYPIRSSFVFDLIFLGELCFTRFRGKMFCNVFLLEYKLE